MQEINSIADAVALLNLYQTQYTQTDKLWGYFATITLAVLAFVLGSEKATKTKKEAGLIVTGYFVFCIGNYSALSKAQEQLSIFAKHAMTYANKAGIPFNNLQPFDINFLSWFYWAVVISVSIGVLFITHLRHTEK